MRHETRGLHHADLEVRSATRGSQLSTRGSQDAIRGSYTATRGLRDAPRGLCDAIRGLRVTIRGSHPTDRGSRDAIRGSCDAEREFRNAIPGSCDAARGSCDAARGSCDAEPGSRPSLPDHRDRIDTRGAADGDEQRYRGADEQRDDGDPERDRIERRHAVEQVAQQAGESDPWLTCSTFWDHCSMRSVIPQPCIGSMLQRLEDEHVEGALEQ